MSFDRNIDTNSDVSADTSLEDVLDHPEIWRGADRGISGINTVPTGFDDLDRYLPGGGWPTDALTEVFVDRYGIGELSLFMPALSSLSRQAVSKQQWIVWVAPPFVPYAPALSRHGIDLSCVLLVHPSGTKRDVLWATEQVIRSRSSIVALAWLEQADATALRRLQLGAEENKCWTVLFRPAAMTQQSSPARLRIKLSPSLRAAEQGGSSGSDAASARVDVLKCRGRRPKSMWIDEVVLRRHDTRDRGYECQ
jgi:hypothetical protein